MASCVRAQGRRAPIAAVLLCCAVCAPAHAHGMFTGFSGFWNGVFHVFISPEQLIGLFALGCAIARLGADNLPRPLLTHLAALAAGMLLGVLALPAESEPSRALPLLFAGLLLIDPGQKAARIPNLTAGIAALATGLACGSAAPPQSQRLLFAAGTLVGAVVVTGLALYAWERLYRPKFRVATQIAGSWMTAIGVILLGASFRG